MLFIHISFVHLARFIKNITWHLWLLWPSYAPSKWILDRKCFITTGWISQFPPWVIIFPGSNTRFLETLKTQQHIPRLDTGWLWGTAVQCWVSWTVLSLVMSPPLTSRWASSGWQPTISDHTVQAELSWLGPQCLAAKLSWLHHSALASFLLTQLLWLKK